MNIEYHSGLVFVMIELIVFDLHGTLTGVNTDDTVPRKGLVAFLEMYKDRTFALATDSSRAEATNYLKKQRIESYFSRIYGYEDMIGPPGRKRKNIPGIARDFHLQPSRILYISDGANDYDTALQSKVNFVHIPYYREINEKFSFALICPEKIKGYVNLCRLND